ncbi:TIGR03086 family metal-binding protein [Actinomadura vinacea]|uniref:TIGR03086 family metal-binding protein n=1 Tax=Actinomadura vinacea TaxID=115336 RepID=A0ABN3ISZ5_9ACTN
MDFRTLMAPAAETAARIVQGVPAGRLDAPTPCPDWDVRALINHMTFWAAPAETAARKERPPAAEEEGHDYTEDGDWAALYTERARRMAEAWSDPAAWEGETSLTGNPQGMPAPVIGGMMLGECVLHGWDLAVATGQDTAAIPGELVEAAYEQLKPMAEMGRQYGAFGEEAKVPEDAPLLDRLLGLSGRDPHWKP